MTTLTNYATVSRSCYAGHDEKETTLKESIGSLVYPIMGILGIVYQLIELLAR